MHGGLPVDAWRLANEVCYGIFLLSDYVNLWIFPRISGFRVAGVKEKWYHRQYCLFRDEGPGDE